MADDARRALLAEEEERRLRGRLLGERKCMVMEDEAARAISDATNRTIVRVRMERERAAAEKLRLGETFLLSLEDAAARAREEAGRARMRKEEARKRKEDGVFGVDNFTGAFNEEDNEGLILLWRPTEDTLKDVASMPKSRAGTPGTTFIPSRKTDVTTPSTPSTPSTP